VNSDASDLLFIGEMRVLKGVDVLIEAIAALISEGRTITGTLVGDGPDKARFEAMVSRHGLAGHIVFLPPQPARQAFARGRILVVPSRAESLPYIVLEAAAAAKPMIATRVGGIPEIYGPFAQALVTPDDVGALSRTIAGALDEPRLEADLAQKLRDHVAARFSLSAMVAGVNDAYGEALSRRGH